MIVHNDPGRKTITHLSVPASIARPGRLLRTGLFLALLLLCLAGIDQLAPRAAFADYTGAVQMQRLGVASTPGVVQITLSKKDFAYSSANQRLYVSVPANAPAFANSLIAINVATGALDSAIAIGGDPDRLAISDDGQYLYAGLNGANSVRRYDIQSQTLGPEFGLTTEAGVPTQAEDLKVVPGQPTSLAISLQNSVLAIYDSGIQRPLKTPLLTARNDRIQFGANASILYGYEYDGYFQKLSVDSNGVTRVSANARAISGSDFKFSQGLVYSNRSDVYDPEAKAEVGHFPTKGEVVPDPANNRVYLVGNNVSDFGAIITACDAHTFLPIASLAVSEGTGQITGAILCGPGMLAYSTRDGQIMLVQTSALQPISPTPLPSPTVSADGVIKLQLAANDLVFDQGTQKVYASVPGGAGSFGNSVARIEPATGVINQTVFIGSEPAKLAVSDNNQYLYAGIEGAGAVRRFDLAAQVAGPQFSLGFSQAGAGLPLYVNDMEVQPGNSSVLAISRKNKLLNPDIEGVAIYDNGLARPTTTDTRGGGSFIEFGGSPSVLYGLNDVLADFDLQKMSVDNSGVTVLSSIANLTLDAFDFKFAGGLLYTTSGQLVDPDTSSLLGVYPVSGLVAPDPAMGRVYYLEWSPLTSSVTIYGVANQTFLPVSFLTIPSVSGKPASFIRWGTDGLAFRTAGNQVYFLHSSSLHIFPSANPTLFTRSDGVRELSLPANDIVYNPADQLIYASVPSAAGSIGNSITSFNPVSGAVGQATFIGSEPGKLALSDTGDTIYAALNGAASVRRFAVPTRSPGQQFRLGNDLHQGPRYAQDLAVAPGNSNLVAVATFLPAANSEGAGVALFDSGVPRPNEAAGNSITFSGSTLYSYTNDFTEFGLRKLAMNSDGLSETALVTNLVDGFGERIAAADGRVYGTDGAIADAESLALQGKFFRNDPGNWVAPDPVNNRVYFLGLDDIVETSVKITVYDSRSLVQLGSLTIQTVISDEVHVRRFIRYGADGLAFNTNEGLIYLLTTSMITPLTATPIPSPIQVTPEIKQYSLSTGDLIYNRLDRMIYASVPSRTDGLGAAITFGNTILPINPVTGTPGQPVLVGSEPKKLAISGNGHYLYAGLDGAGAVCRLDLDSQSVGASFSLGNDAPSRGPRYVDDMEVAPGAFGTLAISRRPRTGVPVSLGLAIYDNGIPRPITTETPFPFVSEGTNAIEYAKTPSTIYGFNLQSTNEDFYKLAVTNSGVQIAGSVRNLFHAADIKFDNGLIYSTSGQVVNPNGSAVVGTYTGLGFGAHLVAPDSSTGSTFFLVDNTDGTATIRAYNQSSFALTGTLNIPGIKGNIASFIRWGANGFAFRTTSTLTNKGNQLYIIQSSSLVPPAVTNAIDDPRNFVRQQYLDFLGREPDPDGWDYWSGQISQCGIDTYCFHNQRIAVSAAFFIELEFQQTGSVVYRMYRAAFGTVGGDTTRANVTYARFIADRAQLIGGAGLAQSTADLANAFVQRAEFKQLYPDALSNAGFVNALFDQANLTGATNAPLRQAEIDAMNNNRTRAQVLLDVIEINEFKTREYNPSFVLMQYFGYLRRDPDQGGYDFWLNILNNQLPNDSSGYRGMVCAFITATEYQLRFGSSVTRSNQDCSQ